MMCLRKRTSIRFLKSPIQTGFQNDHFNVVFPSQILSQGLLPWEGGQAITVNKSNFKIRIFKGYEPYYLQS